MRPHTGGHRDNDHHEALHSSASGHGPGCDGHVAGARADCPRIRRATAGVVNLIEPFRWIGTTRPPMFRWLRRQFTEFKPKIKYDLAKWVVSLLGAGVLAALYAFWRSVQQLSMESDFLAALRVVSTALFWFAASAGRASGLSGTSKSPPVELNLPTLSMPKDIDFHVTVDEIVFGKYSANLLDDNGAHVLTLSVTNRGTGFTEPTITNWKLDIRVGTQHFGSSEPVPIPDSWYILRTPQFGRQATEVIERPTLDYRSRVEGFRRGQPKTGWILFAVSSPSPRPYPHYAEFTIAVTDSMGGTHIHVKAPAIYEDIAEIGTNEFGG